MNFNLRILYTNIRSLSSNYNELLVHLPNLREHKRVTYDVVALSETWIQEQHLNLFPIPHYNAYMAPRIDGRRSGGVVMYVRENLQVALTEKIKIEGADALKVVVKTSAGSRSPFSAEESISMILLYRDCTSSKNDLLITWNK